MCKPGEPCPGAEENARGEAYMDATRKKIEKVFGKYGDVLVNTLGNIFSIGMSTEAMLDDIISEKQESITSLKEKISAGEREPADEKQAKEMISEVLGGINGVIELMKMRSAKNSFLADLIDIRINAAKNAFVEAGLTSEQILEQKAFITEIFAANSGYNSEKAAAYDYSPWKAGGLLHALLPGNTVTAALQSKAEPPTKAR